MKEDSIKPFLPNTEVFQHFEQVERLLGTYKYIYMNQYTVASEEIFIKYSILKLIIATIVVTVKMNKTN